MGKPVLVDHPCASTWHLLKLPASTGIDYGFPPVSVVNYKTGQPTFPVSWFVPWFSMTFQNQASTSNGSTHFRRFWIGLRPNWVGGLLLILSHGLSYVSVIFLYLIPSILLVYILIPDLCP